MANAYRRHNLFGEGNSENPIVEFDSIADLIDKSDLKDWQGYDGFSHFAINENSIMAIFHGGFEWWVAGYVRDPGAVDLPQWDRGRRAVLDNGDVKVIQGADVHSYYGDVVMMKDGRQFMLVRDYRPKGGADAS